jgi:hypothetical protein
MPSLSLQALNGDESLTNFHPKKPDPVSNWQFVLQIHRNHMDIDFSSLVALNGILSN